MGDAQVKTTEHTDAAFALRGVGFGYRYGKECVPVLDDVSLEFPVGRFVCILGPNGSGKTTLLRCMLGLLLPQKGHILLNGSSLNRYSPRELARLIGHVPQESQPAFDYSVLQVVLMGRSPHMSRFGIESASDLELARDCLRQTDTGHLERRGFDELSSGERQRVVIARALAQQPRILLLDEPTSFLDIAHQLQVFQLLTRLVGQGITVVCISHDVNLAGQFADELALLQSGRVVAFGQPAAVLTAKNIAQVYGVQADVIEHPRTGRPIILPHSESLA